MYSDKEKLLKVIGNNLDMVLGELKLNDAADIKEAVLNSIDEQPTVGVKNKAYWKAQIVCSNCGHVACDNVKGLVYAMRYEINEFVDRRQVAKISDMLYCPSCGSEMKDEYLIEQENEK